MRPEMKPFRGGHCRLECLHTLTCSDSHVQTKNTHVFCLCKLGLEHSAGIMTINGEDVNLEPSRTMQCRPPVGGWHYTEPWVIPTEWSSHLLLFCISLSFCDDKVVSVCTHTHTPHTHTHPHTHHHTRWFLWFTGTFHRRNGFYTVQTVCAIALHLPYTQGRGKVFYVGGAGCCVCVCVCVCVGGGGVRGG